MAMRATQRAVVQRLREAYPDDIDAAAEAWGVSRRTLYSWTEDRPITIRPATLERIAKIEGLDLAKFRRGIVCPLDGDRRTAPIARRLAHLAIESTSEPVRCLAVIARELFVDGRRPTLYGDDRSWTVVGSYSSYRSSELEMFVVAPDGTVDKSSIDEQRGLALQRELLALGKPLLPGD